MDWISLKKKNLSENKILLVYHVSLQEHGKIFITCHLTHIFQFCLPNMKLNYQFVHLSYIQFFYHSIFIENELFQF